MLFSHKCLYNIKTIQLFNQNMKSRWIPFNTYLLALLALVGSGCETTAPAKAAKPPPATKGSPKKSSKEFSTLSFHLQVNADGTDRNEPVQVYRENPIQINVERRSFLNEGHIVKASVEEDADGLSSIRVQFNRSGTWLLENVTSANPGKHIVLFSQFGDARFLAAPIISGRITDGTFTFTADASREEVERIVRGLNNVAAKLAKS
jgi:hypothetical protein